MRWGSEPGRSDERPPPSRHPRLTGTQPADHLRPRDPPTRRRASTRVYGSA